MKTSYAKISIIISTLFLTGLMFMTVSCDNTESKNSGVKKPAIDIHTAVITNDLEMIKQHIAYGTNINEKDPFSGSSPLITASLFGKTEIAKTLIEAGADVNFTNNDGSTALHSAAFMCHKDIVQLLLEKGADKEVRNNYGSTALESVQAPFENVKGIYDMMGKQLGAMGLTIDHDVLKATRPEVTAMLQ